MRTKKSLLLIIFVAFLISYTAYIRLINSDFETGHLCPASTECYELSKRILIYCFILSIIISFALFYFDLKTKINKLIDINLLFCLIFNLVSIHDSATYFYLIPLNILIVSEYVFLLFIKKTHTRYNFLTYCLVLLLTYFNLDELFYYNEKYVNIETMFNYYLFFLFFVQVLFVLWIKFKNKSG